VRFDPRSEEVGYRPEEAVASESPRRREVHTGAARALKKRLWFRKKKLEKREAAKSKGGGKGRRSPSKK
jgi:hypothetical protein